MSKIRKGHPVIKADDWRNPWDPYLAGYKVYPTLTKKLDSPELRFTQESINEMVLWKVGRYTAVPDKLLGRLDELKSLSPGEHRQVEELMGELLKIGGVRLPMASTFLRFANPQVFQIFDRHIWRAVYGTACPSLTKKAEECCPVYFAFLDDLHALCRRINISYSDSDRILFEFDKKENPPLSETT